MEEFSAFIIVAAADSKQKDASGIDFVCTGKNDELTIQKAIEACVEQDKSIYLLNGTYHIDDFYDWGDGGPKAAICFPGNFRETAMIGQMFSFGKNRPGVTFYVSKEALDTLGRTRRNPNQMGEMGHFKRHDFKAGKRPSLLVP